MIEYAEQGQAAAMSRASDLLLQSGLTFRQRSETGQPVQTIVRVAGEERAGLIVLGSHGLGGFQRLLLGSVSDAAMHHADCPVLIVR